MNKDKLILDCIKFIKQLDKMLVENQINLQQYEEMTKLKIAFLKDCGIDV